MPWKQVCDRLGLWGFEIPEVEPGAWRKAGWNLRSGHRERKRRSGQVFRNPARGRPRRRGAYAEDPDKREQLVRQEDCQARPVPRR